MVPPEPSTALKHKKAKHQTDDGLVLHSWSTLMDELGMLCQNEYRFTMQPDSPFVSLMTGPSPIQNRALELVKMFPVGVHSLS